MFFSGATADTLSGAPGRVNAVGIIAKPGRRRSPGWTARASRCSTAPTRPTPTRATRSAADRESLVAIFGTMGGIAGFVALFVVAGTFALAIAQRRKETAVLRALGATPRQVRRLIATEALFVSLVAGALGLLAGRPLANALVDLLAGHGDVPAGFEPGHSWIPLVAALGMGVGIAQLAVVAAARRAGKVRPAEALREVAIEHGRLGCRAHGSSGVLALGGGAADRAPVQGRAGVRVLDPRRHPAGGRDRAARTLAARAPGRAARRARCARSAPPGCWRAPGWRRTAGAAPRWRRRSC